MLASTCEMSPKFKASDEAWGRWVVFPVFEKQLVDTVTAEKALFIH